MESIHFYKAIADATRIRLLYLLNHHECSVNEIVSAMNMGQSRISRHLKILTDCGLLTSRRDGLWVFYTAAREGRPGEFNRHFLSFAAGDPALAEDYASMKAILDENRRSKERFFDSIASDWDGLRMSLLGDCDIETEVLSRLPDCKVAADLGCGTGGLLIALRGKAERVIGIDRSPRMLQKAREKLALDGKGIELRLGEIEHLPMRDGEADAVVINMVLHHLPNPAEGIAEAGRVVRPGGSILIVDLDKHADEKMRSLLRHRWLGFDAEQMNSWLSAAGFAVNGRSDLPGGDGLTVTIYSAVKK